MKYWILLLVFVLAGCSSHIYGVPETAWNALTPDQQTETIRGYNERQLLEQQARVHREEQRAAQARVDAELALDRARRQAKQVDAIYRNEARQFGNLIRVSVSGGTMYIGGKPRNFQGLSFKIADGESKEISIWSDDCRNSRQGTLLVSYLSMSHSVPTEMFQVHSSGPLQLQGVQVAIEIIPLRLQ